MGLLQQWFGLHGFLVVPALLYLLYELYVDRLSIYSVWFIVAVLAGLLSGKWGAGDSYFSTAIAATCVLSGLAVNKLRRHPAFRSGKPAMAALLLIPLLYLGYGRAVLHLPTNTPPFQAVAALFDIRPNALNGFHDSARTPEGAFPPGYADIGHLTSAEDIAAGEKLVDLVRSVPGPVLSEDASFALHAGKDVVTNPTQLFNLANNGLYDGGNLVRMIDGQDFDLIILRAAFFPDAVVAAIIDNYEATRVFTMNGFDYVLYRPAIEANP